MRTFSLFTVICLGGVLAGCPTPPEPTSSSNPGAQNPPPNPGGQPGANNPAPGPNGGQAANEPGANANANANAGGTPPDPGAAGEPMDPEQHNFEVIDGDQPSFSSLIVDGGETVTITVSIAGAEKGQVDFYVKEGDSPSVLHVERFEKTDAPLSITAPAKYDGEILVSARGYTTPPTASPDQTISLSGEAVTLSLALEEIDETQPLDGAPPPPPPGGAPAGPAPEGAADGPPPGGDGAP